MAGVAAFCMSRSTHVLIRLRRCKHGRHAAGVVLHSPRPRLLSAVLHYQPFIRPGCVTMRSRKAPATRPAARTPQNQSLCVATGDRVTASNDGRRLSEDPGPRKSIAESEAHKARLFERQMKTRSTKDPVYK